MGGEYMVEIEELKDRVGYIERKELVALKNDITEIKLSQVETNTIVKEFSKAMDTVSKTMQEQTKTMQDMSLNMRDSNNSIKDLDTKFTKFENTTTKEMSDLKNKVCTQENAKWVFIKNNIWKIISFIMMGGVVVYLVLGKVGL